MMQGTCQHSVGYEDLGTVAIKETARDGRRVIARRVLCEACYRAALEAGKVLETDAAESEWLANARND